jgi:hypothetical protein
MTSDDELTEGQTVIISLSCVLAFLLIIYIIWTVRINLYGCGFKTPDFLKRRRYR